MAREGQLVRSVADEATLGRIHHAAVDERERAALAVLEGACVEMDAASDVHLPSQP